MNHTDYDHDPIVDAFLSFLDADLATNFAKITEVDAETIEEANVITKGVTFTDADFE